MSGGRFNSGGRRIFNFQVSTGLARSPFTAASIVVSSVGVMAHGDLVTDVEAVSDAEFDRNIVSFLARRVALLQICSNPGALEATYEEIPAKLLALDGLIHELLEVQEKKVVVWSYYRYSLQQIAERYAHLGLVRIDGSVTSFSERVEAIARFQQDASIRIFLGNAAAAGAGITLTAAHHAIYESFSNQAAHYMQSLDRIHRRGQTEPVVIHILLAKGTIEEKEYERLSTKEKQARELLKDVYEEPITRQRFLADLREHY